jgi:hypothetical protein
MYLVLECLEKYNEANKPRCWRRMIPAPRYRLDAALRSNWLRQKHTPSGGNSNSTKQVGPTGAALMLTWLPRSRSWQLWRFSQRWLWVNWNFGGTCRSDCYLLHASLLLGLFFDLEDGGDIFLRNVSWLSMDYMALYPRRWNSSENEYCAFVIRPSTGSSWKTEVLPSCNVQHLCTYQHIKNLFTLYVTSPTENVRTFSGPTVCWVFTSIRTHRTITVRYLHVSLWVQC